MTEVEDRVTKPKFTGRILFLTEDTRLFAGNSRRRPMSARRLEGKLAERLAKDDLPLMSNISTDEITPGWVCFYMMRP